jgi:hypothetical protein
MDRRLLVRLCALSEQEPPGAGPRREPGPRETNAVAVVRLAMATSAVPASRSAAPQVGPANFALCGALHRRNGCGGVALRSPNGLRTSESSSPCVTCNAPPAQPLPFGICAKRSPSHYPFVKAVDLCFPSPPPPPPTPSSLLHFIGVAALGLMTRSMALVGGWN